MACCAAKLGVSLNFKPLKWILPSHKNSTKCWITWNWVKGCNGAPICCLLAFGATQRIKNQLKCNNELLVLLQMSGKRCLQHAKSCCLFEAAPVWMCQKETDIDIEMASHSYKFFMGDIYGMIGFLMFFVTRVVKSEISSLSSSSTRHTHHCRLQQHYACDWTWDD